MGRKESNKNKPLVVYPFYFMGLFHIQACRHLIKPSSKIEANLKLTVIVAGILQKWELQVLKLFEILQKWEPLKKKIVCLLYRVASFGKKAVI